MRKLNIIVVFIMMMLFSVGLYAQEFSKMDQVVEIEESGAASISVTVAFSVQDTLDALQLACAFDEVSNINAVLQSDGSSLPVAHMFENETPSVHIAQSFIPGDHTIVLDVYVEEFLDWEAAGPEEFGTYEWEMMYENNLPVSIASSSLTLVLPEGWNFHRVLASSPEFKRKDPKPPFVFSRVDKQAAVTIVQSPLHYRDELGLKFAFKQERKGSILVIIGIAIAVLYLYFFRELILKHNTKAKNS